MELHGQGVLAGLDVISIRNLRTWSLIGVYPHEREQRQELRVDAWLGTDTRPSAAGDDLSRSIDYGAVAHAFREHAGRATHQLVETLAEELAALALDQFGARSIRLSVEKLGVVPGADAVGVTIERPRAAAVDPLR
ncbi:MAG: dihydroneopterin aldolase [Planctomycetota bacterium]|nr:dihydroneopterin aldolase [Planctomycetota bacterium]